ncbi:Bromodomain containing protein [Quillaja saponaria]|uniref:Bromodomain containing protein n=1 Tax=Quillaja saponaria TaxID=32244 RepID=A0AAD7PV81_QUISA|nr:Bromodomain containing protein [Quillaja saponaria]
MGTEIMGRWGTWEELLLGGAVLRHGARDWDVVATELRTRAVSPYTFTPEVCKAKYEDLQDRYSGCTALFEELRKKRMAELKKALEQSEDSIGSLESKLESLKSVKNEKKDSCHVDYDSCRLESPVSFQKLERVESSSKETSKDGLSAGSFTQETMIDKSCECQIPALLSAEEMETKPEVSQTSAEVIETKPEVSHSSHVEKMSSLEKLALTAYGGQVGSLRKRRGKRKRKDCTRNIKEVSVGESDFFSSADVLSWCKESTTSNCGEVARLSGASDHDRGLRRKGIDVLVEILNSILENKCASAFCRRLDSQKRGRYKKMIRRHMDFDTIRSRIGSQIIKSAIELFRDLLLLANNALVFYSKSTREYKAALLLRDLVTKKLRQQFKSFSSKATSANMFIIAAVHNPPVKPKSVQPGNLKMLVKEPSARTVASVVTYGTKKPSNIDSPPSVESLAVTKKGFGRPRKVRRGNAGQQPGTSMKGKKRGRTK